jgi:hypothetical protein
MYVTASLQLHTRRFAASQCTYYMLVLEQRCCGATEYARLIPNFPLENILP